MNGPMAGEERTDVHSEHDASQELPVMRAENDPPVRGRSEAKR
jgi:hypothetical protein